MERERGAHALLEVVGEALELLELARERLDGGGVVVETAVEGFLLLDDHVHAAAGEVLLLLELRVRQSRERKEKRALCTRWTAIGSAADAPAAARRSRAACR